jgi:CPA1 family monovalent cation:H+ antiporter
MHEVSTVVESVGGIIVLLLVATVIRAATKRSGFPFTIALVLVGMLLAVLTRQYPEFTALLQAVEISPDLILFVFLPTLIFESAFNMDLRTLRENLAPVLILAVPGLLLSTFLIALVVSIFTPIPFTPALLLGAILSATDPVAVIALFKQLGAPKRLTVLVEGESLFNDATALVLSRIILGVIAAGALSANSASAGVLDFFIVFVGGVAVGVALGATAGMILGLVESDSFIEITITTALAYVSFWLGEEIFHVSGIMATVAAALTIGSWGRMKISPDIRRYMGNFWEYLAFIANALIFLLVGMEVKITELVSEWDKLFWVIIGMLISRAVVVYGLMSVVGRLPGDEPVSRDYQTVMFWGGLRGAIALAIVLSLPHFEFSDMFVSLVTGAVLFTLIVQGLSINRVVHMLGLDKPPLADRFARVEGVLAAKKKAVERIPELMAGGRFSSSVAQHLREDCEVDIAKLEEELDHLYGTELNPEEERRLLLLFAFAEEKAFFIDMFNKGHLNEWAFRELARTLDMQVDAVRFGDRIIGVDFRKQVLPTAEAVATKLLDVIPGFSASAENLRVNRIAKDYAVVWGHYQSSTRMLERIEALGTLKSLPEDAVNEVRAMYATWHESARKRLDNIAEQFPEFVHAVQSRLGHRLIKLTELESIEEQFERGALPAGVTEEIIEAIRLDLRALRGLEVAKLKFSPAELLRKVPFFSKIPEDAFELIAGRMRPRSFSEKEVIIRQGEKGDTLFLIARGVTRVSILENGKNIEIATLMAGDFFGEMALLHREPRTATVNAVTPCSLYELQHDDLFATMKAHPAIREALEEADKKRRAELEKSKQ